MDHTVVLGWQGVRQSSFKCLLHYSCGKECNQIFSTKRGLRYHQSMQHAAGHAISTASHQLDDLPVSSVEENRNPITSLDLPDIVRTFAVTMSNDLNEQLVIKLQPRVLSGVFADEIKKIYQGCFGSANCLKSRSIAEFCSYIIATRGVCEESSSSLSLRLLALSSKCHISRSTGDDLLDIIRSVAMPNIDIPTSWRSMFSDLTKMMPTSYKYNIVRCPWPASFKMDQWNQPGLRPPSEILFRVRSVLQLVAMKLNDPTIMLKYRDHVSLDPVQLKDLNGTPYVKDLVSSPWFHETTKKLQQRQRLNDPGADPKVIAISIYNDGVAMGFKNKFSAWPIMMTLGNFSSKLQQHDITKEILAYVPELGISDSILELHLREQAGYARTVAKSAVKSFKKKLILAVMDVICREIAYGSEYGMKIPILGTGKEYCIYTFISSLPGDIPARCTLAGVYQNRCVNCNESDVRWRPLNYVHNEPRSLMDIAKRNEALVREPDRKRRCTLKKELENIGVHADYNPIYNGPYGASANIFTASAPDIMHTIFGLAKTCMFDILVVISRLAESDDQRFRGSAALFDKRIILLSENTVKPPHIPDETFPHGLMNMVKSKTSKKDRNTSGNFSGGSRSASFMAMLWYAYFAVSLDGRVLPNEPNYHYKSRHK
jgi:Plavaka transposase